MFPLFVEDVRWTRWTYLCGYCLTELGLAPNGHACLGRLRRVDIVIEPRDDVKAAEPAPPPSSKRGISILRHMLPDLGYARPRLSRETFELGVTSATPMFVAGGGKAVWLRSW